jgi:hypothetical protein
MRFLKPLIILLALALLGYAFVRSVRSSREVPYTVTASQLQNWTLVSEPANASAVVLALRPPVELASALFRQLFTRHAESFNGPSVPFVPLVLQDEYARSFAGRIDADALVAVAREEGVDAAAMTPRCMGYRRDSAPGVTRQLYFVVFDAPAFTRFRERLAEEAAPGTGFAAAAMSPVMFVASSDEHFNRWLPLQVKETDCVAPISVQSAP